MNAVSLLKKHVVSFNFELLLFVPGFAIFLPFVILAFYTFPASDDFAFMLRVHDLGFWEAQEHWYTSWTGRFASTLILSAINFFSDSLLLYMSVAAMLVMLSVLAIFKFFKAASIADTIQTLLGASFLFFAILVNALPSVLEAFYWLPAAITYQLACIIYLFIFAYLIQNVKIRWSNGQFIFISYLTILLCGLNEIMIIPLNSLILLYALYDYIQFKKISKVWLLQIIAILSSTIVLISPGNEFREASFNDPTISGNFVVSCIESVKSAIHLIKLHFWSIIIPSILFGFIFFNKINLFINERKVKYIIFSTLLSCLFFVSLVTIYFVGFYSTGLEIPPRSVNVGCFFLTLWMIICGIQLRSILTVQPTGYYVSIGKFFVLIYMLSYIGLFKGNVFTALVDLFASTKNLALEEYKLRMSFLDNCNESCEISRFKSYPYNLNFGEWSNFHIQVVEDLIKVESADNNSIRLKDVSNNSQFTAVLSKNSADFTFTTQYLDTIKYDNDLLFDLSKSIEFSYPLISVPDKSGKFKDHRPFLVDTGFDIKFLRENSSVKVVFCVTDELGKIKLYETVEIQEKDFKRNHWVKFYWRVDLLNPSLRVTDKYSFYIWNNRFLELKMKNPYVTFY